MDGVNYSAPYMMGPASSGGGDGFGMGGGLIGGVVLGALLGRRGGLGGDDGGTQCVGPAAFAAGLNGVTNSINESIVLNKLGSIEAAIPLAEANTQLAIAVSQNAIQGQAVTNATAQALAGAGVLSAINSDGDRTRSLITALEVATLNRELGVAQSALLEERFARRSRESEVNIINTNTNTNANLQAQFQAQAQFQSQRDSDAETRFMLRNIIADNQVIRQAQSNVNFGVQGTAGQTATSANTKVNS